MGAFYQLTGGPLADLLTPSIRLALPFIQSGVSAGLSANQILNTLSAGGLGVRRVDLLKVVKVMRTEFGFPGWIRGTSGADYPHPSLFRVASYPTSKNYTYVYKVTGYNPNTGKWEIQHVTVTSDNLLKSDLIDAMAESFFETADSNYALTDVQAELEQVKLSPYYNL